MDAKVLPVSASDLRNLSDEKVKEALSQLSPKQLEEIQHTWEFWARPEQLEPIGKDWNTWFINAGRGFGKTRAGVEWVRQKVKKGHKRIAAIAATNSDIERVMVKGESGFLNVCWKGDKTNRGVELGFPEYSPTKRTLFWKNGAQVQFFSAEEPERLRGPQFEAAWCFTEGHLVGAEFGPIPIEHIRVGTKVHTSNGLNVVSHVSVRQMPVGIVTFSDGTTLEGTYDHPIYTQRGWVPLGDLSEADLCVKLNTMDICGVPTPKGTTIQRGKELFIDMLLRKSLATSKVSMSTISTVTNSTTTPVTSKFSQGLSTSKSITGRGEHQSASQKVNVKSLVRRVGRLSSGLMSGAKGCIAKVVNTAGLKKKENHTKSVVTAEKVSTPGGEIFAVNAVSTWQPTGVKSVYNLRVENTHEYFCNGILTHNCDELAAWNKDMDTWDMLQFCLRLGKHPRVMVTTTPKPTKLVRKILKDPKTVITTGSTFDNADNLATTYLEAVKASYEGTRLGKQELYAEVLEEAEGALWTTEMLDACQVDRKDVPDLNRIVVAIDPATTANKESDMTGIVVAGIDVNGIVYILGDYTERLTPQGWASKAIGLYHKWEADRIVAEKNQGGDMVRNTLHVEDETVPIKLVHASRGKMARAEPVSALYERGLVKHVRNPEDGANLEELETQMRTWEPLGSIGSPDRLDALVWACTELALGSYQVPPMQLVYETAKGIR